MAANPNAPGQSKRDHDADRGNDLQAFVAQDYFEFHQFVSYQVNGNDDDADAFVTFTDASGDTITVQHHFNGSYQIDLSSFDDGLVTVTIEAIDLSGNHATGESDSFWLI